MKFPGTESATLEFKEAVPKNEQIVKTVIGFCNQKGGKLVIGVRNDGTIVGLEEEAITDLMEKLDNAIYQACSPPIIPLISSQRIGNKALLIIQISAGMTPPYYRTAEGLEKGTYVRLGRSTLRANMDIIEELRMRARGRHFDETAIYHSSIEDIDRQKFENFLRLRKVQTRSTFSEELCKAYQTLTEEHGHLYVTVAGLLLFGKNPQKFLSESFFICTHFQGTSGREALATRDCTGTLFDQFHDAYDFVLSRLNRAFTIRGPRREERFEIPEEALREIILNAVIHRNYRIPAPIKIAIYEDRIEIFSPGTFPGPLNIDELTLGMTYVRNYAISKIFREAGYVEKLGSGFITLFSSYRKRKLETPKVIEGTNFVKVILPRRAKKRSAEDPIEEEILRLIKVTGTITIKDIVESETISRSTAKRKLDALIGRGTIEKKGRGRGTHYILNPEAP